MITRQRIQTSRMAALLERVLTRASERRDPTTLELEEINSALNTYYEDLVGSITVNSDGRLHLDGFEEAQIMHELRRRDGLERLGALNDEVVRRRHARPEGSGGVFWLMIGLIIAAFVFLNALIS